MPASGILDQPISVELPLICFGGVPRPELACPLAHYAVLCLVTSQQMNLPEEVYFVTFELVSADFTMHQAHELTSS